MRDAWTIEKRSDACSACRAEIAPGARFHSALHDGEQGLRRRDYCTVCWRSVDPDTAFCHWRSRRPSGTDRKRVVDTSLMLEFFDRLANPDSERKKIFRFVLALYLMRRKEFKLLGMGRSGESEVMKFARRTAGDEVAVENPDLTEEQIDHASEQLTQLLNAAL
jgi:hypothetical protein